MRRTIFLLILLIHIASTIHAQDTRQTPSKGLSFSLSLGIPVSTFAAVDKTSDESGYALPGLAFDASYLLMSVQKPFGFLATVRYNSFGYDMDAVAANSKASAPPGEWYGEGENWKMFSILAGGYFDPVHSKSFALSIRAQGGWLLLMSKERYISGIGSGGAYNVRYDYKNESSGSFTYLVGLNIRTAMSPAVSFTAGVDYMNAAPSVNYSFKVTSAAVVVQQTTGTFTQPINALLVNAGFIFLL